MPRYLVERTFQFGLEIPVDAEGARVCKDLISSNATEGVTWLHSYVSEDHLKTFCIYDAPSPEAIRRCAERNRLPVERITQVSVLAPYFYR